MTLGSGFGDPKIVRGTWIMLTMSSLASSLIVGCATTNLSDQIDWFNFGVLVVMVPVFFMSEFFKQVVA
jgi:hypothetical protein